MKVDRAPQRVPGAVDIAKVACGAFHSLALNYDGEVVAWGINDFGQLGDGTTSYSTQPVLVAGLQNHPISDISAGGWHSVAISDQGGRAGVRVWSRCPS